MRRFLAPKVETHRLVEKVGGFVRRETQVGGAQFGHLAARAQPGQRELGILSAVMTSCICGGR